MAELESACSREPCPRSLSTGCILKARPHHARSISSSALVQTTTNQSLLFTDLIRSPPLLFKDAPMDPHDDCLRGIGAQYDGLQERGPFNQGFPPAFRHTAPSNL